MASWSERGEFCWLALRPKLALLVSSEAGAGQAVRHHSTTVRAESRLALEYG